MLKLALRVKVMALTLVAEGVEINSQAAKAVKDLDVSLALVQRHPETETRQLIYHFFWNGAKLPTKRSNSGEGGLVF